MKHKEKKVRQTNHTGNVVLDSYIADVAAAFEVLKGATALYAYLAQGFVLSAEEREALTEATEKIEMVIVSASSDAGLVQEYQAEIVKEEADRQMMLLSLARLAAARPGFDYAAGEIADKLKGREMFDEFKRLNADHWKPDHSGNDGDRGT